jgi:hypothetical protein
LDVVERQVLRRALPPELRSEFAAAGPSRHPLGVMVSTTLDVILRSVSLRTGLFVLLMERGL